MTTTAAPCFENLSLAQSLADAFNIAMESAKSTIIFLGGTCAKDNTRSLTGQYLSDAGVTSGVFNPQVTCWCDVLPTVEAAAKSAAKVKHFVLTNGRPMGDNTMAMARSLASVLEITAEAEINPEKLVVYIEMVPEDSTFSDPLNKDVGRAKAYLPGAPQVFVDLINDPTMDTSAGVNNLRNTLKSYLAERGVFLATSLEEAANKAIELANA